MSARPVKPTPEPAPAETLEQRFRRLEATWEAEAFPYSDPEKIIGHPAFQEIIRMGEAVVPLMLRDIEEKPRLWVWALSRITGQNPVPPEDAGYIRKMGEAWLRWGKEKGYQW